MILNDRIDAHAVRARGRPMQRHRCCRVHVKSRRLGAGGGSIDKGSRLLELAT